MSFKIPPECLPSKWWPNRPLMMQSDLPTLPSLPEAGQSCSPHLSWSWNWRGGHCGAGQGCPELVTADSSWLRNGPTTCQSGARQTRVRCLCENILRKGQKMPKGGRQTLGGDTRGDKEGRRWQGEKQGHEGRVRSEESPKGLWPVEGPRWSRVMKWVRRKQKRKKRVRNKERQREATTSWPQTPVPLMASLKIPSVICGDNKRGGDVSGAQLSLGKGKERCFNVCLLCFPIPESATKCIKAIN